MEKYDHKTIEKKWQETWEKDGIYKTVEDSKKEKCYVLDMFPYPSGVALHVGHPKGYIATDVYTRYKKMKGFNILHPMGWDAFGLPAENYAIKNKVHPRVAVEKNIATYKEQLGKIGLNYDWDREINTTDPEYYKWTQWMFLQLWKKGLAYESHEPINWCPSCKTGLANEDLENGHCERCGSIIEKKPLRQWVLKITDYADRMLDDLDLVNWSPYVKDLQRYWIGRSEGLVFTHQVKDSKLTFETFSAHFEQSYADSFIAIAPDHPLLAELITGQENAEEIRSRIEEIEMKRLTDGYKDKVVEGVFTGRYAIDPLCGPDMPIWVASFALSDYGTGIIRCSKYDERDVAFADKYDIKLKDVDCEEKAKHYLDLGVAKKKVMYKLRDWVFSRQRYWGEPIPLIHCGGPARTDGSQGGCGVVAVPESDLPVRLPEVEHYEPTGTGESPLAGIADWVNVVCPKCKGMGKRETNTMPQWAGSSWYYLRYMDPKNTTRMVSAEREKYWGNVDLYVGIGEHITRHMIYARFWHKFLYDQKVVHTKEPFPNYQKTGLILGADGRKMSKRWNNVVNPDDVIERFGADTYRLYTLFLGPFDATGVWNTEGIVGPRRFLEKVWRLQENINEQSSEPATERLINDLSEKVGQDIEQFKFNTAIPRLMTAVNTLSGKAHIAPRIYRDFLLVLAPFAPHIAEELWSIIGNTSSVHLSSWPESNDVSIEGSSPIALPVQIGGKVRTIIYVSDDITEDEVKEVVLANEKVMEWLGDKIPRAFIYKKGKVVSIVI
ncbi:MAG TPA: class I tRNA ligase family protein [Candidatus Paceibacterota bacterium]